MATIVKSSDQEVLDAEAVEEAVYWIQTGRLDTAEYLLKSVIRCTPADFCPVEETAEEIRLQFWSLNEFLHYSRFQQDSGDHRVVVWVKAAYPIAFYYLGFIAVQREKYHLGLEYLEAGAKLQPEHPLFSLEMGRAWAGLGEHERALECFQSVEGIGPFVSPEHYAVALRGAGVQLIDLHQLHDAEESLKLSLHYDPENEIALHELNYIQALRRESSIGNDTPIPELPTRPLRCDQCGSHQLFGGHFDQQEQGSQLLCRTCAEAHLALANTSVRKWWQFWK